MLVLSALAVSGLFAPAVLAKHDPPGATDDSFDAATHTSWPYTTWMPGTHIPSQEPEEWALSVMKAEDRYADALDNFVFVPFEEFSESKEPIVLAKDLLRGVLDPEIHALVEPALVCRGDIDDRVVCSHTQATENNKSPLEPRYDRKNCVNCIFHAGDCSKCPWIDGTTESCSSEDSASDDSELDCPKRK